MKTMHIELRASRGDLYAHVEYSGPSIVTRKQRKDLALSVFDQYMTHHLGLSVLFLHIHDINTHTIKFSFNLPRYKDRIFLADLINGLTVY